MCASFTLKKIMCNINTEFKVQIGTDLENSSLFIYL